MKRPPHVGFDAQRSRLGPRSEPGSGKKLDDPESLPSLLCDKRSSAQFGTCCGEIHPRPGGLGPEANEGYGAISASRPSHESVEAHGH